MAKFEEADPRWRVKDMGDQGRNVNNWLEKLCTDKVLSLADVIIFSGPTDSSLHGEIKCVKVDKCSGEASLNRRKGNKIMILYEIQMNLKWEAVIKRDGGDVVSSSKGTFVMPCIDTVEDIDGFEVEVKFNKDKSENEAANKLAKTVGVRQVRSMVATCIKKLQAEASASDETTCTPRENDQPSEIAAGKVLCSALKAAAQTTDRYNARHLSSDANGIVNVTTEFNAPMHEIFECFTLPQRLMAFTQSKAQVGTNAGDTLSLFDGSITGSIVECVNDERVVWRWRQSSWAEGVTSQCTLTFTELGPGSTRVSISHVGIPQADAYGNDGMPSVVEQGWKRNFLDRIKMVFGYGVPEFH